MNPAAELSEAGRDLAEAVWRSFYADGSEAAVSEAVFRYDVARHRVLAVAS